MVVDVFVLGRTRCRCVVFSYSFFLVALKYIWQGVRYMRYGRVVFLFVLVIGRKPQYVPMRIGEDIYLAQCGEYRCSVLRVRSC